MKNENLLNDALLSIYKFGFAEELSGSDVEWWRLTRLLLQAYKIGREDAIAGDVLESVDCQTNEQIINRIRNTTK